jgi:thiamine biosynthesis lipoprotein
VRTKARPVRRAGPSSPIPWPSRGAGFRSAPLALALTLLATLLSACREEKLAYTTRFPAFGTLVDLYVVGASPGQAERAGQAVKRDFAFMNDAWRPDRPGPLYRVNSLLRESKAFLAPSSVLPLIREAQSYAEQSQDLFNPAIGRMLELWGFVSNAPQSHAPPDAGRIEKLVAARPRMGDIHIEGIRLRCDNPAVSLDFRGFAVGRAIDVAVAHLKEMGTQNAMVSAGGNVRVIGDRAGRPWRVTIRRASGGGVLATVAMGGDESLFTTTDYERTFFYNGKTYHDNLDPRSGYPARGTRSVAVITKSAAAAAAAAEALFVAGPAAWHEVAEHMAIPYVLLIDRAGDVHMNPAMARRVKLLDQGVAVKLSAALATKRE